MFLSSRSLYFLLFSVSALIMVGCSKNEEVSSDTVSNAEFSLVSPEDGAEDLHPGFEFKWTPSQTAESYRLHVRDITDMNNITLIDVWNIESTSHAMGSLQYSKDYSWKVAAVDQNGKVTSSSEWTFHTKKNTFTWDDHFYSPQLQTHTRIFIYLPPDYETSDKRYPVLYMADGLNMFQSRGYRVNTALNTLFQETGFGMIVIAIVGRGDRLIPWVSQGSYDPATAGRGGLGNEFLDYVLETLKPAIDSEFRTLTDTPNTGIGGASLAGLISFYAAMRNPEVFGRAIVLSPSFWYVDENMYDMATERVGSLGENKIYFWIGGNEVWDSIDGNELAKTIDFPKDIDRMTAILEEGGFYNYKYRFVPSGGHSTESWSRAIPEAIEYLFIE